MENYKPKIFFVNHIKYVKSLKDFKKKYKPQVIDNYKSLLKELCLIEYPELKEQKEKRKEKIKIFIRKRKNKIGDLTKDGVWVYYPWNNKLIHCLNEEEYFKVRTARNHNLITIEEQEKLRAFKVGIVGLSVGQASALTLSISGMCDYMKLIDPDIIEATNLNRIHASLDSIGTYKTELVAQKIYQINPFAKLSLYNKLLSDNNIESFLLKPYKLDAVIDAFDDVVMKIKLRIKAREKGIPVLMATDLGNGAIIDIERYDLDKTIPIFNGRVNEKEIESLPSKIKYKEDCTVK